MEEFGGGSGRMERYNGTGGRDALDEWLKLRHAKTLKALQAEALAPPR